MIEGALLAYLMAIAQRDEEPDFIPADIPPSPDQAYRSAGPKNRPHLREQNMKIGSVAKAIVGGVAAGTASLVTAVDDGVIVYGEWVTIALAVLGALGVVYAVPNAAKSDPPQAARGPYPMS